MMTTATKLCALCVAAALRVVLLAVLLLCACGGTTALRVVLSVVVLVLMLLLLLLLCACGGCRGERHHRHRVLADGQCRTAGDTLAMTLTLQSALSTLHVIEDVCSRRGQSILNSQAGSGFNPQATLPKTMLLV
jgi:hypothetical protein